MKKMSKVAAILAALVLVAGLTACQKKAFSGGLMFSNGLIMKGAAVTDYTPDVPAKLSVPKGTAKIGENAFANCLVLASVTIPDTVMTLSHDAFNGCKNLKSAKIGNGVEVIGYSSFEDCKSLASVTMGDGVKAIGSEAFKGCENLKSVKIPSSVETINSSAFAGCENLASVTMPGSMKEIKGEAFKGCDKLEVTYEGTKTQWDGIKKDSFNGIGSFVVHCTDGDVTVKDKKD
ncbi:MAG: leucine-rich repeat domain-containing protein [Treponemataceae bacterium]|nr:leucine-rich repeat domain-containing protein [Treponemataceae bacterium]